MNQRSLKGTAIVSVLWAVVGARGVAGCGDSASTEGSGAASTSDTSNSGSDTANGSAQGGVTSTGTTTGSGGAGPCTTRISYGDLWIHADNHPDAFDDVEGAVSWDGACQSDGANSFATLSNGFKPYFKGQGGCVIALDSTCGTPSACITRVTYGASWIAAPNHPAAYDDVAGKVYWNRQCANQNGQSIATLSNGWAPHFSGADACDLSFSYSGCGGLYENAVLPDCADPGVYHEGAQYVLVCTSGNAANAFPIRVSSDLRNWTAMGAIFPSASKPTWAVSDFWAPEIHHVSNHYVAYFTARKSNGKLSIGAATAMSATGPFTDIGSPLVEETLGAIDATELADDAGNPYLIWKIDGNSAGKPTPLMGQALTHDGTALSGTAVALLHNDESWEGPVVEAPWVVHKDNYYYLFYSGNTYYDQHYPVGVSRSTSPLGPYEPFGSPILSTDSDWIGPGHCSVVDGPSGDTTMVYHAWLPGHANGPGDHRLLLLDPVTWSGGWPSVPQAPSSHARLTP